MTPPSSDIQTILLSDIQSEKYYGPPMSAPGALIRLDPIYDAALNRNIGYFYQIIDETMTGEMIRRVIA